MQTKRFPDGFFGTGFLGLSGLFLQHLLAYRTRNLGIEHAAIDTLRNIMFSGQNGLDNPVRQQIRIPSDRTCKMCIGFVRQTEMTDIVWTVHGLLHRT